MATASRRRWSKNSLSRRPLFEILEQRAMLAAYTWSNAANTLSVQLAANESVTVSGNEGTVIFTLSGGVFTAAGGDVLPGENSNLIAISSADLAGSVSISNTTVADPGSNTVRFSGPGALFTGTLSVTLTDADADSEVSFVNGYDVTSSSAISLAARRIVAVNSGSVLTNSGDGGITISGNRQATQQASSSTGVFIRGEVRTTGSGDISLSGRGGTFGGVMPGVWIFEGGQVKSTATGDSAGEIIIDGIGGTNPGSLVQGVLVDGLIESVDGDIQIKGVGGNVTSDGSYGLYVTGQVRSTGTGAGAAKITIDGTGLSNSGIQMLSGGNISSVDGAIDLIGEAPITGPPGIQLFDSTSIQTTGTAAVTLTANQINLNGTITAGNGSVLLRGKTSGFPIWVGGPGSVNVLDFLEVELDRIETRHLQIGDSSSGDVTISNHITRQSDLSLTSGTEISLQENITLTVHPDNDLVSPADLTLDAPTINVGEDRVLTTEGSTITVQGGLLNVGARLGSLTAVGRLLLASDATYQVDVAGPGAGTEYDQIVAQEPVLIDSARLGLHFTITPAIGDFFVLIDNQKDNGAITGTFADLPEGGLVSANGMVFQISYAGGFDEVKDVVITRVTPPDTASLVVNNTSDVNDGNYGPGQLTLREAMLLANLQSDQSNIAFDATVFAGQKTIMLVNGELPAMVQPVNITGPGADRLTIDATGQSRHLQVASEAVLVSLSGMTFVNGFTNDLPGGSIENNANLNLSAMMFEQNVVDGAPGGAIANAGLLIVNNSAFIGNQSDNGGAIFNTGTLRVFNTTISGNSAIESGGGVANFDAGTSSFVNCTIVDNTSGIGYLGGGIFSDQMIVLGNTIVAGNTSGSGGSSDVIGTVTGNNNLIGDAATAGGFTDGVNGNIVGINGVGTRPLNTIVEVTPAFNGGPTKTHQLVANSEAIDAGRNDLAVDAGDSPLQFDQRGTPFDRIVNDTVDIGAYELALPPILGAGNVTASVKDGKLKIKGDAQGNAFRVTQVDGDSYRIEGIDQTTINGLVFVVMDRVTKDWTIDLGRGADTLFLGTADSPVNVRGNLEIETENDSSASDSIQLTRVSVQGKTMIEAESQALTARIVDAVFQGDFNFQTCNAADDEVTFEGTRFHQKVRINLDGGNDLLTIRNTRCDSDAEFNLARGKNDRADVGLPRSKRSTPNSNGNTFKKTPDFSGVEVFL